MNNNDVIMRHIVKVQIDGCPATGHVKTINLSELAEEAKKMTFEDEKKIINLYAVNIYEKAINDFLSKIREAMK